MARRETAAAQAADEHEENMTHASDDAAGDLVSDYGEDVGSQEAPVPLPTRDYEAEIRRVEKRVSRQSGEEYYAVTLFVSADQYPPDYTDGEPEGTTLTYRRLRIADTPQGRYRMKLWYETIQLPPPGRRVNAADWLGRKAKVTVTHEEYEGEQRAVASRVSRL